MFIIAQSHKPMKLVILNGKRQLVPYDYSMKQDNNKQYNQERYKSQNELVKFYKSKLWRDLREIVLIENFYTCVMCGHNGNVVDHIEPIKVSWKKRLDKNNLQVLCSNCHNKKTKEDIKKYKDNYSFDKAIKK